MRQRFLRRADAASIPNEHEELSLLSLRYRDLVSPSSAVLGPALMDDVLPLGHRYIWAHNDKQQGGT